MKYDPTSPLSRGELALSLISKMEECGFVHLPVEGTYEAVYHRPIPTRKGVEVRVYTSIEQGRLGPECRGVGADAIRVCAVYVSPKTGQTRGLARAEARVHRVGETEDIVSRTHSRMREVWGIAIQGEQCPKCGAPFFLSKKGNKVCADVCWAQ